VLLYGELHSDGKRWTVKAFEAANLVEVDDGLEIGRVVLRDLTIKDKVKLLAGNPDLLADDFIDIGYFGLFDFVSRHDGAAGFDTYFHTFEIEPLARKTLPNGRNYNSELETRWMRDLTWREDKSKTISRSQDEVIDCALL